MLKIPAREYGRELDEDPLNVGFMLLAMEKGTGKKMGREKSKRNRHTAIIPTPANNDTLATACWLHTASGVCAITFHCALKNGKK
jgi:hypothetical protein